MFIEFLRSYMKEIAKLFLAMTYATILPLVQRRPYRIVLYYHGVGKKDINSFERQIAYIAELKCKVVKASEIFTAQADGYDSIVAITFDDAFVSVVENAVPILRKYGLPAAIFVPVGNLGQRPRWERAGTFFDKNEIVMSREQIAELDNDGFEIFSHTLSHPVLTGIEDNRLEVELVSSKSVLEEIIGHEISAISYPHGIYDARVCKAVHRAGYKLGFTIEPTIVNSATDCLKIGRFLVSPRDSFIRFKLNVSGAYQVIKHLQELKAIICRNAIRDERPGCNTG